MNAPTRPTQPQPAAQTDAAPATHSGAVSGSASPAALAVPAALAAPSPSPIEAVAAMHTPAPADAPALSSAQPTSSSATPHLPARTHPAAAPATATQTATSTDADRGATAAACARASASPSLTNTAPTGVIVLDEISVRYQGTPVLRKVSARFACGQRWAIVGANGCGKSTLLKAAMRLLHCEAGQVHWQNLHRADIAYLPQQAGIDRNLPVRVQDLVALGLWHKLRWWRGLSAKQWARVHAALDQVGLLAQAREPIAALSSGQFQRVLFARMLVQGARMLLLDEPFNAVDAATTADLLQLLHDCARQGAGIVAVVHDQAQARQHFDHILRLDKTAPSSHSADTNTDTDTDTKAFAHTSAPATANADAASNANVPAGLPRAGTGVIGAAPMPAARGCGGSTAGPSVASRPAVKASAAWAASANKPSHAAPTALLRAQHSNSHSARAINAHPATGPAPHAAWLATPLADSA